MVLCASRAHAYPFMFVACVRLQPTLAVGASVFVACCALGVSVVRCSRMHVCLCGVLLLSRSQFGSKGRRVVWSHCRRCLLCLWPHCLVSADVPNGTCGSGLRIPSGRPIVFLGLRFSLQGCGILHLGWRGRLLRACMRCGVFARGGVRCHASPQADGLHIVGSSAVRPAVLYVGCVLMLASCA